jgi:hypothetical protein
MTEQERLLYEQQQRQQQQNMPQLAPAKTYALGQNPGNYAEGQRVSDAYKQYQGAVAAKPADYASPYQGQIDAAYQKILSRQPFKYDMNADAMYQQYKDAYTRQGGMAMRDTMGQAAAMTGGYGNSYAQTAGQQAYQGYMQGLNDKVPELADRAFNRYQSEGNDLYNQLAMSQGMDQTAYGKYRDQVGDWQANVGRLQGDYASERGFDIDMYRNAVSDWQNQQSYDFNVSQFDYQKQQDAQARADAQAAASKSGRGGSGKPQFTADEIAKYEAMIAEEERQKKLAASKAVKTLDLGLKQSYDPYKYR